MTLLLAALAAAAGCAPEPDGPDLGSLYRHSLPGVPVDLDPAHSGNQYSAFITQNLYQTLFVYRYLARPYRLKPELAAVLPEVSADGLRYLIRIRPGQRFADDPAFPGGIGREIVAADVVYSLQRHFDPATRSQGQWLWRGRIAGLDDWAAAGADYDAPVAGLKVLDRHWLELRLTAPYPPLLHTLANPLSAVVPREAVARHGREFGVHPVGSGPYRLAAFDSGHALLVRNPNYGAATLDLASEGYQATRHREFGLGPLDGSTLPLLERVSVDFIPDDAARWLAFNSTGGIQFLRLPADQIDELLSDSISGQLKDEYRAGFTAVPVPELGFVRLDFNFADPGIGNVADPAQAEERRRLRCALAATVDWEERNRVFYHGMGIVIDALAQPAGGPAAPRARRRVPSTLAELDLRRAPPLNYGHLAGVRGRQEYAFFRDAVVRAGYPGDRIAARSYATLGDLARGIANAEINVYLLGWVMDYPDPINNFELFYGPNALPGANYSQYRNPEYDALFERASSMAPTPEREDLLERLQALLDHDCVTVPGLVRRSVFMYRREIAVYPDNGPLNGTVLRYVGWRR